MLQRSLANMKKEVHEVGFAHIWFVFDAHKIYGLSIALCVLTATRLSSRGCLFPIYQRTPKSFRG
jgi:hypothetical protein